MESSRHWGLTIGSAGVGSKFFNCEIVNRVQAVDWWERAGQEALERGAQLEALRLFARAAGLADALHAEDAAHDQVCVACTLIHSPDPSLLLCNRSAISRVCARRQAPG